MMNRREQGNEAFKRGQYQEAIDRYSEALQELQLNTSDKSELTKCFSNRSQCYLNLNQYEEAIDDATRALESSPSDLKSLYRRATAFEKLGKLNEAIDDAQRLISVMPKENSTDEQTNQLLRRLRENAQSKHLEQTQLSSQIRQLFDAINDEKLSSQALNNLLILSREDAPAEAILQYDSNLQRFQQYLQENHRTILLGVLRLLGSIVKNSYKRASTVYKHLGLSPLVRCLSMNDDEIPASASMFVHNLLMSICDLENRRKIQKPFNVPFNFTREQLDLIDAVFRMLNELIDDKTCSPVGRDCCLDLVVKFVDRANGCNWTSKFILSGVPKVLRVAATIPDFVCSNTKVYSITDQTKMHISCVLNVVYQDLCADSEREDFNNECVAFIRELKGKDDIHSKMRTIAVLSVLLQGPFETGNTILGSENLVELMLEMAKSADPMQQRVAIEAIVLSASKKDKAAGILAQGAEILQTLSQSSNEEIRLLALVGLAKIASSKGTDASGSLMKEGTCQTLARSCCEFLTSTTHFNSRRWAADGIAYLSLDADVKEDLVENLPAVKALFQLSQSEDNHVLFSILTIFVNLTNTYDIHKPEKEMLELAAYAKQHIPKEHPKDEKSFVDQRRRKLVEAGLIPVLVHLCKHKSNNCRELISRVFLGLCENEKFRGPIVAAGGGKALLPLALEGTTVGMTKASQALAKIAITTNPEIAFPGQRMLELVRPILKLLKIEHTALENFEALMALTNLASIGESIRKRILKEGGFSQIEQYMFEEHPMLQRAATECMCNMVVQDELIKHFIGENDRIKLLVLFCGNEDDELLIKAALGTLAILSSLHVDLNAVEESDLEESERQRLKDIINHQRVICDKMLHVQSFSEIFKRLCACQNSDLQFRALYILRNIVKVNKILAQRLVETDLMDILFAIHDVQDPALINDKNRQVAWEIVQQCLKYGLIQANKDRLVQS